MRLPNGAARDEDGQRDRDRGALHVVRVVHHPDGRWRVERRGSVLLNLVPGLRFRVQGLQGNLADKNPPPPRTTIGP